MKGLIKTLTALLLVLALGIFTVEMPTSKVKADEPVTESAIKGEDFLKEIKGEYVPLFIGGIFNTEYDHYWHDYTAAIVGESMADMCVAMMKQAIGATAYGDEAGDDFFCGYTENVAKITFGGKNGTKVTFTKNDGKKITHNYVFVKNTSATGTVEGQEIAYDGYLYKSKDGNNDEFAYIFMCPDTPATTYHLEFRYGSSEEEILKLTEGKYKNWLSAGFPASAFNDPQEIMIQKVIALFALENLSSMSGAETIAQRSSMAGVWSMDTTPLKDYPGYENASMIMKLSKTGSGKSYVDMVGSGDYILASQYPFFIYATDKNDDTEKGVYIVLSEDEGTKTATYEISVIDGTRTLVFHSSEGDIKYFYNEGLAPENVSISKAKAKSNRKISVSWKAAENAEGYEIVYSTDSSFKKAKTKTITGKTSGKTKKLKSNTYYVKVRAFSTDYAGNKVYGEFSEVKTVVVE
ncbi:MAG: hypothetical protein IKP88_15650 [Lachnospiraceae bacterium]|nr:hypothetical protein [Lachnospiraceae bacterium]